MITQVQSSFSYHLVETDGRMMLESTCKKCGASKLVSDRDGSLREWEMKHSEQCRPVNSN